MGDRFAFTFQVPGVVLIGTSRVRTGAADARWHGLDRVGADVGTVRFGDVISQQLRMQADMARWPQQVVVEGGRAHAVVAVTLGQALHDRGLGQVGHHARQTVFQGDVDAVTGRRTQDQRFDRHTGFQLAGDRIEIALAYIQDRGRVMQRPALPADGEGLAIFKIGHCDLRNAHWPRVQHQGAARRFQRPADMLAETRRISDRQAQRIAEDVVGQRRDHFIVALHGWPGADAVRVGANPWADAVERHGIAHAGRLRIVRHRKQVAALRGVVAHHAPDPVPVTLDGRVHGVEVVTGGRRRAGDHRHRRIEAHLLGDPDHLRRAPARVGAVAEAGTALQPFHAVQGDVVLLFVTAGMHPQPHVVTGVGAQHRRERIARFGAATVDVRREQRGAAGWAGGRGDQVRRQVHRRDRTVGTALHGIRQVAAQAIGLHAALAVRADLVRVVNPQGQRFVAVVDDEHARVIHRDRLRAWAAWAARFHPAAQLDNRFKQLAGVVTHRWVDRVAEAVGCGRERLRVRHAVRASADVHTGFIGVLEVAVFEEELAEAVVLAVAVQVTGGDHRLPRGRPAVLPRAAVQRLAGFGVEPSGTGRFSQYGGVQTNLLVSRWAEVVVGEDGAQATVDAIGVHHRVDEPALHGRPRAHPISPAVLTEERVILGFRASRGAVTRVGAFALVELADGVDAFLHGAWGEHAVFVVPAVGRTIGGHQVPLRQVNVLADHVGRRAHLIVVHLVGGRNQVGLLVLHAVEGVHAHHQRFWRTLLGDHRPGVFPQRKNARLREVVADLVVHRVELDVRRLVDPRTVRGEGRGTDKRHTVEALATDELTGAGAADQAFLPVIHARFVVRRTGHRQGAVGAEVARHDLVARQDGKAWMVFFRVEGHGRLFDFRALFRHVDRFGPFHFLGEVQRRGDGVRLATLGYTAQGMTRQAAVPAAGLIRVEVGPQRFTASLQGLRRSGIEHVQRWGRWALADRTFHAADPEWIAWVFQGAIGVAVGFAAIDQRQRADGSGDTAVVMLAVIVAFFIVIVVGSHQGFADFRHDRDFAWHWRHGFAWQWNDCRDWRTGNDFAIGQGPCVRRRFTAAQGIRFTVEAVGALLRHFKFGAFFKHVVHPPHGPHALGKVRVEVAVINRIARDPVTVARTTVGDFIGVAGARPDALGIDVVGVVVIGVEQPLMAVQVEDVVFVTVVRVAEFDEVTDVAVSDVRRLRRIQRGGRLDPDLIGIRCLAGGDAFQPGVGRYVHQHRHVADGVGTEEELFIGAGQAIVHRPHAQAVGEHLGAHATGAIVDHERVAGRLQHMGHDRVCEISGKRLGDCGFILELRGEIAERLKPIGDGRVAFAQGFKWISGAWETAVGVAAHDNGISFAGNDFIAVDHVDDRLARLAFANPRLALRVACLVIDDRLTGRRAPGAGQTHFFFGDGVAVVAAALGHHRHLAEQTVGIVAGRALATERCATAAHHERTFALGIQGVGTAGAGGDQSVGVAPGIGRNVIDAVDRLHAVDLEADVTVSHLFVGLELGRTVTDFDAFFLLTLFLSTAIAVGAGVGLVGQQVLQVDGQAVTGSHPQYQRTRTLVGPQGHFARHCRAALLQRDLTVIDHVASQGEHHAVDVLRPEAVEHQRLIQRHDVGHQVAFTARSCFGNLDAEHRSGQQQPREYLWSVVNAGHDHGPHCGCSQGIILDKTL
ncbi:hypothetical protein D3C86_841520 [compost metagenome]